VHGCDCALGVSGCGAWQMQPRLLTCACCLSCVGLLILWAAGACGQLVIEHKQQLACSQEAAAAVDVAGQDISSSCGAAKDIEELGLGVAAVGLSQTRTAAAAALS
jgi:hypothetical protein